MGKASHSEHRNSKRITFVKDVEVVEVGLRRSADISIGGMYLETMSSFPIGSILDLRFKLQETDERPIEVQAKVLYEHGGMGIGLCFVNLSPEDRDRIQKLIDQN